KGRTGTSIYFKPGYPIMKTNRRKAKLQAGIRSISVTSKEAEQKLEILRPDAAGIDCGAQEHYVAVPVDRVSAGQPTVRCFSAFTEGLDAAVDWLKECRVTTVAMESTGVYRSLLDPLAPEAGSSRHRSVFGQRTSCALCAGAQDRCEGQPVAAPTASLRLVECFFPARGHYVPTEESASSSR